MRCTGMGQHLKRGKDMIDKARIESTREEKRMKNNKLEEQLHENHRVSTLIEKNEGASRE